MDYRSAMEGYLDQSIAPWASDPVLVSAIQKQNAQTAGYDSAEIDRLDQAWRSEVGMSETPTIDPVVTGVAADFLREHVAASGGTITEIFVMDAQGLNVAASAVTSDYWQGDEAKFTETYNAGPEAVHFGDVEFDESSQTYQAQISLTITDESGKPVGAMTVGIVADALM
ncbi:cache domain-containing protein [Allosediminivita pacifica]|uniref:Cache domain-containing protein n=1 Tax=Allosediminivita pacifica TaxID=1267769 RepID=A0A2T6B2R8_9RHOB|nr:cache domain-containing protein [Allosediminivita pacifica]PTX50323.1 hypothetical protein C8N44_105183 [Allosediminivita pacifica]GGB03188.1 hypothetical protein GCM10011324_11790 [Allosediminivita pacifica]